MSLSLSQKKKKKPFSIYIIYQLNNIYLMFNILFIKKQKLMFNILIFLFKIYYSYFLYD